MNPFNRSMILRAEHQLQLSKHEARAHYRYVRTAIRSSLEQPLSLLIAAGTGTLIGAWIARQITTGKTPDDIAASPPLANLMSPFFIHIGMRRLAAWARHL